MTSTLLDAPSLFDRIGEGGTLDELIVSVWEGLRADRDCRLSGVRGAR